MNYLSELQSYRDREIEVYKNLNLNDVNLIMNVLEKARKSGKHIFICGNGGSASTASHFVGDFNKEVNLGLLKNEKCSHNKTKKTEASYAIPLYNLECLSDNISSLMAISNDESYAEIFRFPLSVKMKEGDVVIGISGSGNSINVVNALQYAKDNKGIAIAFVGFDGGRIKELSDYCIHVEIDDMQISEDLHMIISHMIMSVLKNHK